MECEADRKTKKKRHTKKRLMANFFGWLIPKVEESTSIPDLDKSSFSFPHRVHGFGSSTTKDNLM